MLLYSIRTNGAVVIQASRARALRLAIRIRPRVRRRRTGVLVTGTAALTLNHCELRLDATAVGEVPERRQDGQNSLCEGLAAGWIGVIDLFNSK